MKILLIKPKMWMDGDVYKYRYRLPPLGLGIIAALSEDHYVKIVDEDIEDIEYSQDWNLAGITTTVFNFSNAYSIAGRFRALGVKTVLGGPHPSLMPEESSGYCDSVVIGEAEPVWRRLLYDLEKGNLQKIYNGGCLKNLDEVPFPRRDLFSKRYFYNGIQATRGCTNSCYYCYLRSVPWGVYRTRPIERVYEEMAQIKNRHLHIVDDNLFGDFAYVKRLCEHIAPLKKRWGVQAPTTIAQDEELLEKIAMAGCYLVGIGFQSVNQDALDAVSVTQNKVSCYREIIKKLHRYGIFVGGFFVFGLDGDDRNVFANTVRMIKETDLDDVVIYILTPFPGTALFAQMKQQQRLLENKFLQYSTYKCVFYPKLMEPQELEEGFRKTYERLNKYFKRSFLKIAWKHKHWLFKDTRLAVELCKDYFNFPDPAKMM